MHEINHYYSWGQLYGALQQHSRNLVLFATRNQFKLSAEYSLNKNWETEATYERYLYDYLRVFGGVNVEKPRRRAVPNELGPGRVTNETSATAVAGLHSPTPYLFSLDARIGNTLRPRLSLARA